MKTIVLLCIAVLLASAQAITPFTVPFSGTSVGAPSETAVSQSVGEVITGVSQVTSFTFYVTGVGAGTGTGSIASWDPVANTASPAIISTSVALSNSATSYAAITVTLNAANLNPTKAYVIYITFPASIAQQYKVSTVADSTTGAYVQASNGNWAAGFNQDVRFSLVSTNTLSLSYPTYSVGTGKQLNYNCYYNTSYTCIQADWQKNLINTAYFGCATTTILNSGCASGQTNLLGSSNTCGWAPKTFVVDLRGTNYAFTGTWTAQGWPDDQTGTYTFSNNNQTVSGMVNGDCSDIRPTPGVTQDPNGFTGGLYISIAYIGK